jgi:MoaA/NifB/PqqE/SkfB family radical SAM enzyme
LSLTGNFRTRISLEAKIEYDIEADWILLSSCNFRCYYCYWPIESLSIRPPALPEIDKIAAFFDDRKLTWLLHITGGEPFLIPDFIKLCEVLTRHHFISVNTNLSLSRINDFIKHVSPDRTSFINCSIHIEERERRNIVDDFIQRAGLLEKAGFRTLVSYVCYPTLLDRLQQNYDHFLEKGIVLIPKMLQGIHEKKEYPAAYTLKQREIFLDVSLKAESAWLELHKDNQEFPTINMFKDRDFVSDGLPDYRGKMCNAGYKFVRIRENGDIRRCGPTDVLGNIFAGEFQRRKGLSACKEIECPYFCEKYVIK